jgi:hypothetical protein
VGADQGFRRARQVAPPRWPRAPRGQGQQRGFRCAQARAQGRRHARETLERYNDAGKSYGYRAKDGGALPVTNYTSTITVTPDGGKSTVEWRGRLLPRLPQQRSAAGPERRGGRQGPSPASISRPCQPEEAGRGK